MTTKKHSKVIAFHPYSQGIAYALFESPQKMIDCGNGVLRFYSNEKIISRVQQYLEFYDPEIVILKTIQPSDFNKRLIRIVNLIRGVANNKGLTIKEYSHDDIWNVFNQLGCTSKYDLSQKLIETFPVLEKFRFQPRKPWGSQPYGIGVFDAAALGVTWYHLG